MTLSRPREIGQNVVKLRKIHGRQTGDRATTNGFKAGFSTAVFIAFFAVFAWAGGLEQGWSGFLLLIPVAPFSVWAAIAITKDEELRDR
jgi:hypothetical protein